MTDQDRFKLDGDVIILTGGGGLLGPHYAEALAGAGARVVVADIDEAAAERVASRSPQNLSAVCVDVADEGSVRAMVEQTRKRFGRIDGLVNNAALDPKFDRRHADEHSADFESYPVEMFKRSLDVNVTGMFLCAQAVAPVMREQGKGAIVNVASTYGMVGPDQRLYDDGSGGPKRVKPVAYSVTKSAVFGFTRYLATYFADSGIRVNTLTLGGVFNEHDEGFVERYSARTPMGRMARTDEYCGAMLFLLSDASSYMTGSNLVVDGGWTAW